MREPEDVQRIVYRNGEPWLALGPGCLPLERREGCAVHVAREFARARAA